MKGIHCPGPKCSKIRTFCPWFIPRRYSAKTKCTNCLLLLLFVSASGEAAILWNFAETEWHVKIKENSHTHMSLYACTHVSSENVQLNFVCISHCFIGFCLSYSFFQFIFFIFFLFPVHFIFGKKTGRSKRTICWHKTDKFNEMKKFSSLPVQLNLVSRSMKSEVSHF